MKRLRIIAEIADKNGNVTQYEISATETKARVRGQLKRYEVRKMKGHRGKPYVVSYSETHPNNQMSFVDNWACSCAGFIFNRRCKHCQTISDFVSIPGWKRAA